MTSIRRMTRNFTHRSEQAIIAALTAQVRITREGAALALETARGGLSSDEAREAMSEIEHRGDDERGKVIAILASALASPIDREDLFRLSRSIDDVLDNLRDFVREYDLFDVGPEPLLAQVLEAVDEGIVDLGEAVNEVQLNPRGIRKAALKSKKNRIRPMYQLAMAELLSGQLTPATLKCRELLRRLDVVGLRLGEAADALSDGAMKRSQ